jgi:hypothetical protein
MSISDLFAHGTSALTLFHTMGSFLLSSGFWFVSYRICETLIEVIIKSDTVTLPIPNKATKRIKSAKSFMIDQNRVC